MPPFPLWSDFLVQTLDSHDNCWFLLLVVAYSFGFFHICYTNCVISQLCEKRRLILSNSLFRKREQTRWAWHCAAVSLPFPQEQEGYRKKFCTVEHIHTLSTVIEKSPKQRQSLFDVEAVRQASHLELNKSWIMANSYFSFARGRSHCKCGEAYTTNKHSTWCQARSLDLSFLVSTL